MIKTTLAAAALAVLVAMPAMAQWSGTTMPLGGGWQQHQWTGPGGQSYSGTTMPMGNGWSNTTINGPNGSTTCTTMPMGSGWSSTNCY